ncbi:MAG: DUF6470 family protein [Gracilibacteraceae bacterium]|jgi:hypothetical protein|nr:DUF6470 family protein [Gracilibacteraceae bacterium]
MAISLSIHQQYAQIGLKTKPCQFELRRTPSDCTLERTPSEVNLTITPGQVSIDMTRMQNSLGYGSAEFVTQSLVAEARQIFETDLVRTVQAGDALAKPHMAVSIGRLAAQAKYFDNAHPEVSLEYIAPPAMHYKPTIIQHEVKMGQVTVNVVLGKVEMHNYTPAEVEVYLERAPELEISAQGWAFDFKA